jgi:hypothetical protein
MVSKVDRTVDYGFKSWLDCWQLYYFKKKSQHTVATSRLSIFRGFCLIDFSGKVASKSPNSYNMASKSQKQIRQSQQSTTWWQIRDPATVDFSRESWPYCRLWFQKLTILSTLVSKVDWTVDFQDFNPTNVEFSKNSPATVDLWPKVDCRFEGLTYPRVVFLFVCCCVKASMHLYMNLCEFMWIYKNQNNVICCMNKHKCIYYFILFDIFFLNYSNLIRINTNSFVLFYLTCLCRHTIDCFTHLRALLVLSEPRHFGPRN